MSWTEASSSLTSSPDGGRKVHFLTFRPYPSTHLSFVSLLSEISYTMGTLGCPLWMSMTTSSPSMTVNLQANQLPQATFFFPLLFYLFFIRSHTLLSARRVVPLEIPRSLRWHIHWVALVTLFGQGLVGIKTRLTSLGLGTVFDAFWWSGRLSRGRRRVGEGVRVVR